MRSPRRGLPLASAHLTTASGATKERYGAGLDSGVSINIVGEGEGSAGTGGTEGSV